MICRALCSHEPILKKVFDQLFFKKLARCRLRKPAIRPFLFAELFLWGYILKEKADERKAVVNVSATNYRYQDSLAAFLSRYRRLFSCLPYGSHLLTQNRKRKSFAKKKCRSTGLLAPHPRQLFEKSWSKTFFENWFVRT